MKLAHLVVIVSLGLTTAGCRSQESVRDAYDAHEGTSRVYPLPAAEAYDLALQVLEDEEIDELREFPREQYAIGGFGMTFISWGTWVGVWIDPVDAQHTEVTVVTKRKMATNIATVLTETTFHERFRELAGSPRRSASR
jgi:hypothetical protein